MGGITSLLSPLFFFPFQHFTKRYCFFLCFSSFSTLLSLSMFLSDAVYFISNFWFACKFFLALFPVFCYVFFSYCLCCTNAPSLLPTICSRSHPHLVSVSCRSTFLFTDARTIAFPQHLWDKSCGLNNGFPLPRDKISLCLSLSLINTHCYTNSQTHNSMARYLSFKCMLAC